MMRRVITLGFLLCLLVSSRALAVGEAAAPSLIISPSARAWGLGQSYVAVADDATAIYWNPGGLGFLDGTNMSLTHSQLIPMLADDVYFESVNVSHAIPDIGVLGLNAIYLTYGKWWETTAAGEPVEEHTSYEFAFGGYYAFKLNDKNSVGIGLKVSRVFLAPPTAQTDFVEGAGWSFAADFGLLGKVNDRFSYGVALQNLGPDMSFVSKDESAPLPRTLRGGIAFKPFVGEAYSTLVSLEATKALIGLDEIFTEGNFSEVQRDATVNGGLELSVANFVAPRVGFIYDHDGKIEGVTYGFGVRVPVGGGLNFDYASVPKAEDLGRENKFSLNYAVLGKPRGYVAEGDDECRKLTQELETFNSRLETAQARLEEERTLIDDLSARISGVDTEIEQLEADITGIENEIEEAGKATAE
jgi:long-subunit fatty acid transport protein